MVLVVRFDVAVQSRSWMQLLQLFGPLALRLLMQLPAAARRRAAAEVDGDADVPDAGTVAGVVLACGCGS